MRFQGSFSLQLSLLGFAAAYSPSNPRAHAQPAKSAGSLQAVALPLPGLDVYRETEAQAQAQALATHDQWVANLDYEGFGREVTALGKELQAKSGQEDVDHLNKIVSWRNACAVLGLATLGTTPNPITIAALSTWTYASWTMVAHHTCHGGYNRVDAGNFNSRGFALGSLKQRCIDWLDWMAPEAWNVEHNRLHHYRLNEASDPDLVQRNLEFLREAKLPMILKYFVVASVVGVWKWSYYAPNTFKELQINKWKQNGRDLPSGFDPDAAVTVMTLLSQGPRADAVRQVVRPKEFITTVLGPFFMARMFLLPVSMLLVPGDGFQMFTHAVVNLVAAELLTNMHAFVTIVTNHAGEDLYTFDDAVKPRSSSFYVRQIVGSANYETGGDVTDFSHGFLNYQIEHHVWPDLSMRQYQIGAPLLKKICEKYGVPYVQESVWTRLRKTVDVMVGKSTMRSFPTQFEPARDKATAGVTWKTTNGAIDDEV
jgi:hypothetical protein